MSEMTADFGGGRERKVKVNYPGNSEKGKNPNLKALEGADPKTDRTPNEKVVSGTVTRRKKPLSEIGSNSHGLFEHILNEVLLPAAKNMLSDAVSQGIDRLLFGESRSRNSNNKSGYTSYNRVPMNRNIPGSTYNDRRDMSRQSRANHNFDEIILADRAEADEVIERLRDLVDRYEQATVNDLYELIGITGSFTDDKWGWTDLRSAGVRTTRGGYLLNLPRTEPLE